MLLWLQKVRGRICILRQRSLKRTFEFLPKSWKFRLFSLFG
jgi:hypothetical protein